MDADLSPNTWRPKLEKYSHDALVAQIIANPTATNKELGAVFGRSREWIGLVRNSDLFREKLAQKHAEISDPIVTATLEERLSMLTNRSVEVLMEKLNKPADMVPDGLAVAAAQFGARAKGVGGFAARVAIETPAPQADRIERLAERLERLNGMPRVDRTIIDVETKEAAA